MRGDTLYEVWGVQTGREKNVCFNTYKTREEAEQKIVELKQDDWAGTGKPWTAYHDEFKIRIRTVETNFELPSLPTPREQYTITMEVVSSARKGTWNSTLIHVLKDGKEITSYTRNYPTAYGTFEPFRKNGRDYALISPHYTKTSVLDLTTGDIIAEEQLGWRYQPGEHERFPKGLKEEGFCPVGFYVPDWWDLNDGSILPGSHHWDESEEWPTDAPLAFVWGCYWGDDTSWKVQLLDLSDIENGVLTREERFGYIELDSYGDPKEFIRIYQEPGYGTTITFSVPTRFDLSSGNKL